MVRERENIPKAELARLMEMDRERSVLQPKSYRNFFWEEGKDK